MSPPIESQREPSRFQRSILEWIRDGSGDAVIEAVAGSGKTTTLEMAWQRVRLHHGNPRAIFLAFNKTIAVELQSRLQGMTARTLHSLGNQPTKAWIGRGQPDLDEYKYVRILHSFIAKYGDARDRDNFYLAEDLKKIVNLGRMALVDMHDAAALRAIAAYHNIGRGFGRIDRYLPFLGEVCDTGLREARELGRIDFADQLWIPIVKSVPLDQFDWIFVDEAQDLNTAQLELVLRSRAAGGRLVFVGDSRQAIYGFAGADSAALRRITSATQAVSLPLSITYRCARTHVEVARRIAPQLEARPDAPDGVFEEISIERGIELMAPGDLVLCRESAPIVGLQRYLDDQCRDAYVEDDARRKRLLRQLDGYRKRGVSPQDVVATLEEDIGRSEQGNSVALEKLDRLDGLKALHSCLRIRPADSYSVLESHVERVFAPRTQSVRCMTIHKAKGLEADRVFLVRPDLMPHRYATMPWQEEQEENLLYVALTRAKTELYVCFGEIAQRYLGADLTTPETPLNSHHADAEANLNRSGLSVDVKSPRSLEAAMISRRVESQFRGQGDAVRRTVAVRVPEERFVTAPRRAIQVAATAEQVSVCGIALVGDNWVTIETGFRLPRADFALLIGATVECVNLLSTAPSLREGERRISRLHVRMTRSGEGPHGVINWSVNGSSGMMEGAVTFPEFRLDDLVGWLYGEA